MRDKVAPDGTPDDGAVGSTSSRAARVRALYRSDVGDIVRPLVLPLVLALPGVAWVSEATHRASLETLGRDQGIFQYIAQAILRGATDYRDIRDVNGPLTHLIHMIFLRLGGADEHRFRVLDLTVTGVTFAVVGACLPGLTRAADAPAPRALERVAWGFAGWVILSAQYLRYLFWDLAQRESFFDWFMLVSVGLQLAALSPAVKSHRSRNVMLAVSGAFSFLPWFGKPTFALFTVAEVLTFAAVALETPPASRTSLRAPVLAFLGGGLVGSLVMVGFLLVYADIGAFLRIYFLDVPHLYRFIWPRSAIDSLSLPGVSTIAVLAVIGSVAMLGLILDGQLPKRALAVALVPLAGIASVIVQAKGFPYHFHPVSAGLYLQGLVLVLWLSEQLGRERRGETGGTMVRAVPFAAATALNLAVVTGLLSSPHLENWWILQKGVTAELRESQDYLVYFKTADFFPWELRQTAAYLRQRTRPDDKVQLYGMDPYLLFLADRMNATPYIYAYDLDVDAALVGSALPDGLHPTWEQQLEIRAIRDEHERDFLVRVMAEPPAAFVFMDRSPLMSEDEDAWLDFLSHSPKSAAWVLGKYRQTAQFGDDCVWLRNDLAEGEPTVTRAHAAL
jgi:hypothetical protein